MFPENEKKTVVLRAHEKMMSVTHETANNIGDIEQQGKGAYKVASDDGYVISLLHFLGIH